MSTPQSEARVLTWGGLCITGAAILLVASVLLGVQGGAAHAVVDFVQYVVAWTYLLGTPVVAVAGLLLGRRRRWMAWSNAAVLGGWLLVFVASFFFMHH